MRPQFIGFDEVTNMEDAMQEHQNVPTTATGELDREIARQERIAEIVEDGEVVLSAEEKFELYKASMNRKDRRKITSRMEQLQHDVREANRLSKKDEQKKRDQRRRAKASKKANRKKR